MLNIVWTSEKRKVADLKEWPKNPRKISSEEFEKLKAGIVKRGFHDVLKVDTDGTILSGHQRKRALKELGVEEVFVLYPNRELTEEEKEVIALESNRHRGEFDFDALANGFGIESLYESGFKDFELGFATSREQDGQDTDTLGSSMETYLGGNVKQIVLYFSSEEFEDVVPRIDRVMEETGTTSHTEAVLELLKRYEGSRAD